MRIYNLFPILAGRFDKWGPHFERAASMGFDWVFVNPIQRPGMSGSLYSTADYHQINPLLVDPESETSQESQARAAIDSAERLGLKLMVDLVINHCAIDSNLTREHPEWFVREGDGSIAHPFCMENGHKVVWGDLAKFDHKHTSDPDGLFNCFLEIIDYLIGLGFKGFRCDAAYQIPRHLWKRLIGETRRRHPEVLFTAETLGCTADQTKETAKAGFDYVFNSSKWWDLGSPWLLEQYNLTREVTPSISFPESHDTERLFEESHGNFAAMKQRYLFSALFSAGVMVPIGYEFGFRKKLHVVETRPEHWEEAQIDLREYITDVNTIKARYKIFQEECPTNIIGYDNPAIMVMWKASVNTNEEALLILNKDPWNNQHFHVDDLQIYIQAGAPLMDVSPEQPMDYLAQPFSYDLRPGEGRVLVTSRDAVDEPH